MSKLATVVSFLLVSAIFGCGSGSSYTCEDCTQIPDALQADDQLATGVYKGVLVGEVATGTIMVDVKTDQTSGVCKIVKDGQLYESTDMAITQGSVIYTFTHENYTFTLEVTETGEIIGTQLVFGSEDIETVIVKEKSDTLVECFEGDWTGNYSGVWNFVIAKNIVTGRYDGDSSNDFTGTVSDNKLVIKTSGGSDLATGTRSSDKVSGQWNYFDETGGWSGIRAN